jgi:UDP-N-acetylglucosamine 2-epimerase
MRVVKILCVAGSRGERAKLSPVIAALEGEHDVACAYVSCAGALPTWDAGPPPPLALQIVESTPILRAGAVLRWIEPVLEERAPQVLLTCGCSDAAVGAQLAAALVADVTCAHLDAGVIAAAHYHPNARLLDQGSTFLLAPHAQAAQRLAHYGMEDSTCMCGDTLADAAPASGSDLMECGGAAAAFAKRELHFGTPDAAAHADSLPQAYCLCYLGGAALESPALPDLLDALDAIDLPVLMPSAADTTARLQPAGGTAAARANLRFGAPLDYAPMQAAVAAASLVVTDSPTLQREAYFRGKLTLALAPDDFPEAVASGWLRPVTINANALIEAARQPPPPQSPQVEAHRGSAMRAARFITGL